MKALNYYVESWRRFGDFRGRSSRPAYWWPFLLHLLIFFVLGGIFAAILDLDTDQVGPEIVYFIAYVWLSIALGVRRLHDVGRKGTWLLLGLVPLGNLVLLYWLVQPSSVETNEWGDPVTQGGVTAASSDTEPEPLHRTNDIIR